MAWIGPPWALGGLTDIQTDGRMEILPCVLQDIVPFGSAAQKGSFNKTKNDVYLDGVVKTRTLHTLQ